MKNKEYYQYALQLMNCNDADLQIEGRETMEALIEEYFLLLDDNKNLMKQNYTLLERVKRLEDRLK